MIIPTAKHLSRHPRGYAERRTIIETKGGARLLTATTDEIATNFTTSTEVERGDRLT